MTKTVFQTNRIFSWISSLAIAMIISPAQAAERIELRLGAIELGVSVKELETYIKEEQVGRELGFFLNQVKEGDRKYVREFLTLRTGFKPLQVSQFFYSKVGEQILEYLGDLVQIDRNLSGSKAIRAGLILAAADSDGLSFINFVRKYPTNTLRINVGKGFEIADKLTKLAKTTESVILAVDKLSTESAKAQPLPSLTGSGQYMVKLQTEILKDPKRDRTFTADFYLPQGAPQPAPVIVLSHGLASNRQHFAPLAKHLASYGFVAVTLEHPGSNTEKLQKLLEGLTKEVFDTSEFIDRPKDVSYVLDYLAQRLPKAVNVQQAGIVGHSFGGYTALAMAGAVIDFDYLTKECSQGIDSANVSLILQCQALKLPRQSYNFRDQRIKFALAINPIDSSIFGPKGLAEIQIPVAIAASSDDAVASAVLEQVRPFSWMVASDRYLFVVQGVGHASDIRSLIRVFVPSLDALIPENNLEEPLKEYSRTFVLALVQTHVANRITYRPYLQPAYAIAFNQTTPNRVSILRALSPEQFKTMLK